MRNVTRKALVKTQPVKKSYSLSRLAGAAHMHFCIDRECRLVYECSCETPEVNGPCAVCRGTRRAVWTADRDPHECCLNNCKQVLRKEELIRYQLAGPGPWFQCSVCARCHGWPCVI